MQNQPSVLLLDDLDHAMPLVSDAQEQVKEEGINSINKTQVFWDILCTARKTGVQMLVVASAQNQQQINKDLLTSQGRQAFDKILEIKPPSLVSLPIFPLSNKNVLIEQHMDQPVSEWCNHSVVIS